MKHQVDTLDKKGLRDFGLVTGAIVVALFGLLLPWLLDFNLPYWPWYIAGVLWTGAVIYPQVLNPIYHVWMRFGLVLGWINTRIILGVIFYVIFTPVSMLFKILNKDPMRRKKEAGSKSYRIETKNSPKEQMGKPY